MVHSIEPRDLPVSTKTANITQTRFQIAMLDKHKYVSFQRTSSID